MKEYRLYFKFYAVGTLFPKGRKNHMVNILPVSDSRNYNEVLKIVRLENRYFSLTPKLLKERTYMKKHDSKIKSGDKKLTSWKKQSVGISQELPAKELVPIYNEDTKSLPIALKEKITTALSGITDEKMLAFLSTSLNCEEIRQDAMHYTLLRKVVCQRGRCPLWIPPQQTGAMPPAGSIAPFVVSSPFHGLRVVPRKLT